MSSRTAPSLAVLSSNDDFTKSNLRKALIHVSDQLRTEDILQIRNIIAKLKDCSKRYFDASRALSKWYQDRGS